MKAEPAVIAVENITNAMKAAGAAPLSESQSSRLIAAVLAEQTPLSGLYRMNVITPNVVQAGQTVLDSAQQAVLEQVYARNRKLDDAIVAAVDAKRKENATSGQ